MPRIFCWFFIYLESVEHYIKSTVFWRKNENLCHSTVFTNMVLADWFERESTFLSCLKRTFQIFVHTLITMSNLDWFYTEAVLNFQHSHNSWVVLLKAFKITRKKSFELGIFVFTKNTVTLWPLNLLLTFHDCPSTLDAYLCGIPFKQTKYCPWTKILQSA